VKAADMNCEDILKRQTEDKTGELLSSVLDSLEAIIYVADIETYEIRYMNKYSLNLFGDLTGKICWQTLQHGQTGPCDFCTNDKLLTSDGRPAGVHHWEFRNTVTGRWYDILDRAIEWEDGRIARLEIATDITDRKDAEEALKKSEDDFKKLSREFQTLLNAIPDYFVLLSPEMKVLWANSSALSVFRKRHGNVIGVHCYELWFSRNVRCDDCPAQESFRSGITKSAQMSTPEGRILDVRTTPIIDENGRVINVIKLAIDVTEKEEWYAEAMRSSHLASLGELAAGVAHEINNPINTILLNAQIAKKKYCVHEQAKATIDTIIKGCNRTSSIVQTLLSFARADKDEEQPVRLRDVLLETFELTGHSLGKEGIDIRIDVPEGIPLFVANPHRIGQVFLNILSNSRYALNAKYPDGHDNKILDIHAGTDDEKKFVHITFRDHGTGMSDETIRKALNPFFSTKEHAGTGLGLSISYNIICDYGGSLQINSREGEFTEVTISLPAGDTV
jgi:signal transduction histidine kinase